MPSSLFQSILYTETVYLSFHKHHCAPNQVAPLTTYDHSLKIDFGDTFPSRRTLRNQFLSIRHSQNHQPSFYWPVSAGFVFPSNQNIDARCPPLCPEFNLGLHWSVDYYFDSPGSKISLLSHCSIQLLFASEILRKTLLTAVPPIGTCVLMLTCGRQNLLSNLCPNSLLYCPCWSYIDTGIRLLVCTKPIFFSWH